MNQQPDKLFRDNLEGFSKPAPSRAWDRVEKNLDKKNLGMWWKIAAAVLLLATATYILWPTKDVADVTELSNNQKPQESIKPTVPEQTSSPLLTDQTQTDIEPDRKKNRKDIYKNQKASAIDKSEIIEERKTEDVVILAEVIQQETPVAEHNVTQTETMIVQHAEPITQNITLVFRADDTDEYLNKKVLTKATEEEEKASTFKKLLKKAKGLKNNQDPYGELRQKKNEFFALNFKSEKEKRGQNK